MMLNVQKDSAMQKSGRKTFYMWEVAPDKDQGNQVNKWLPSTANLPSMLGTWYTGQPWPHSMLQVWVSSNEVCQPSQEGRTWGYHEAEYALDSGTCPQTGYHQKHQVPGAPPMPLTISMYLFSGVEMPRNWQKKKKKKLWLLFHLAPCDSQGPLTTLLLAQNSPLLLPQRWLVNNISPYCEAWWLKLNSQSAGTQWCPALSWVSVLVLQPDS